MVDFIKQWIVSTRDPDFTTRVANRRSRRADPEQEIILAERQLSAADHRVTSAAIDRRGDVMLDKARSNDAAV